MRDINERQWVPHRPLTIIYQNEKTLKKRLELRSKTKSLRCL